MFQCRGDVNSSMCHSCVQDAAQVLTQQKCPSYQGGVIWYDECLLRYQNTSFYGEFRRYPSFLMWNLKNSTSQNEGDSDVRALIFSLIEPTAKSVNQFVTKEDAVSDISKHKYALMQCTRDLNESSCRSCLTKATNHMLDCCTGYSGWRYGTPNCFIRYEVYLFYQNKTASQPVAAPPPRPLSVAAAPPPLSVPNQGKSQMKVKAVIVAIFSSLAAVFVFVAGFLYFRICRKKGQDQDAMSSGILINLNQGHMKEAWMNDSDEDDNRDQMHFFSLAEIQAATNDFSKANKLGEGGFGPVYKGKMRNGKEVAIKRLSLSSSQGLQEFKNEVKLIIKLQHKNLVKLLGYCLEGDEKLLVYEYMANTSLDTFLFDSEKCKLLDWETRANIIIGTAKGMQYLHEDSRLKIIHRDLKVSNILLDEEMTPKISDFGTARIFGDKQLEAITKRVVGTLGYMAPEYALEGFFSMKSDVYSYGILMLEVLSSKRSRGIYSSESGKSLQTYAWMLWEEGKAIELVDQNIVNDRPLNEVLRWVQIALLCVQDDPGLRPTMSEVVLMLVGKLANLPKPMEPPYSAAKFVALSINSSYSGGITGSMTSDQSSTTTSLPC